MMRAAIIAAGTALAAAGTALGATDPYPASWCLAAAAAALFLTLGE